MAVSTIDPNGLNIGQIGGRRNLLINSGFDVWQRGTSFTGAGYTTDRWVVSTTESGTAITKTANRDKRNTLRITFGSTISCNLDQRIEAFGNVGYNQQVTLSFYVRGSRATTTDFCRIRNHTTSTTLETLTYDITTSWTKVTKTFSANNTWSKDDVARLYLFVADASSPWASGDWVEFSDVQLEVGDVATPFEHRSYEEELSACQRYFQRVGGAYGAFDGMFSGQVTGSNNMYVTRSAKVTMRSSPTFTLGGGVSNHRYSQGGGDIQPDSISADQVKPNSFTLVAVDTGAVTSGNGVRLFNNSTNGYYDFDAEL